MPAIPTPLVPDDDGHADPDVTAALAAFATGAGDGTEVVDALRRTRLLVPVVAQPADGDHVTEMALPTLVGADGRTAVPVFTGLDALGRWRSDARPIQVTLTQVCAAALGEDAAAVVVDIAGPVPFVIEIAGGGRPSPR